MKKIICFLVFLIILLLIVILFFPVNREHYAKAEEFQISHQQEVWIHTLEFCESQGREDLKILDSNNRYSYGVLMFQMETFLREGKKYGLVSPKLTPEQAEKTKLVYSTDLQESIANRILLAGGESNWFTCFHTKLKTKYPQ